jgi:uncharacterized protein
MYLLVDGHSVIYAWASLRQIHQERPALARDALIRTLEHLHDSSEWRVTVVFDGRYGISPPRRRHDMVVAYSSADESADSIIERLVGTTGKAGEITVVTADLAERRTVESLGALSLDPAWLAEEIDRTGRKVDDLLQRIHHRAKW